MKKYCQYKSMKTRILLCCGSFVQNVKIGVRSRFVFFSFYKEPFSLICRMFCFCCVWIEGKLKFYLNFDSRNLPYDNILTWTKFILYFHELALFLSIVYFICIKSATHWFVIRFAILFFTFFTWNEKPKYVSHKHCLMDF